MFMGLSSLKSKSDLDTDYRRVLRRATVFRNARQTPYHNSFWFLIGALKLSGVEVELNTSMENLDTRYDHKSVEEKIYRLWEKSGYFNPDNLPSPKPQTLNHKPFCIIMPPNNANGSLHIGHAVGLTLQDVLVRFWRMRGRRTLWLPGADHAGFETQVVYDKKLEKEGRNRYEIDREELWQEIWDFTQKNKEIMYAQTKKLGSSCDWSREKFTLDPEIVKTVYDTFEKLWKDGLVYRDLKIVNWCPKHRTALSDLEVKYLEREDPLYYIKYGPLTLATVRPETKFGDTALAVNPKDKRYKKYIGKIIEAKGVLGPLKFKVIGDDAVDQKFGTGVVKVTPAHDAVDFEIWQRHKNEIPGPKVIIDETGRLTGEVGEFKGLKVADAREKVAARMKEIGILEKVDPHYTHQIATCYKCGNTLEPLPKPQWFIKTKLLAEPAIKAVKSGRIKIFPKHSEKTYFNWLKNIRDWNISRQIVWGIRIPAWFCLGCREPKINPDIKAHWFIVRHGQTDWNKERRSAGQKHEIPLNEEGRRQVERTAETLTSKKVDLIISSDLVRCRETAEIISKATGAEIVFDKAFRERHEGRAEGMLNVEIDKKYPKLFTHYDDKSAENETYKEAEERVSAAFAHHKKNHHHKNIVIVTHSGVMKTLLKRLKNWDVQQMFAHETKNAEAIQLDMLDPCSKCGGDLYEQDPDVFDTWFSSGQWPFATLMSTHNTKHITHNKKSDFEEFYPTDVMETGYDILFFWVARMVMLGLYRTGKVPFKTVYLHGLVRDKDRQKMSKSKGNVIDPLGVAEIYGTDAVRMALTVGNTPGNDIVISEEKIRGYRNFATKIWNIARFVLMHKPEKMPKTVSPWAEDKKNLKELKNVKTKTTKHMEKFEFHLAAETIYHYIWHTFADKIIEEAKPRLQGNDEDDKAAAYRTLETILSESLKILHPFMPFVTEEIWQKIHPKKLLMVEEW